MHMMELQARIHTFLWWLRASGGGAQQLFGAEGFGLFILLEVRIQHVVYGVRVTPVPRATNAKKKTRFETNYHLLLTPSATATEDGERLLLDSLFRRLNVPPAHSRYRSGPHVHVHAHTQRRKRLRTSTAAAAGPEDDHHSVGPHCLAWLVDASSPRVPISSAVSQAHRTSKAVIRRCRGWVTTSVAVKGRMSASAVVDSVDVVGDRVGIKFTRRP